MMSRHSRSLLIPLTAAFGLLAASAAVADGDVRCNAGPRAGWQPIEEVKKKAPLEGWTLRKAQIEGDCFEMYARTADGETLEAFFHPVTLEKLVVYRRGQEIYRAPGFDPRTGARAPQPGR